VSFIGLIDLFEGIFQNIPKAMRNQSLFSLWKNIKIHGKIYLQLQNTTNVFHSFFNGGREGNERIY